MANNIIKIIWKTGSFKEALYERIHIAKKCNPYFTQEKNYYFSLNEVNTDFLYLSIVKNKFTETFKKQKCTFDILMSKGICKEIIELFHSVVARSRCEFDEWIPSKRLLSPFFWSRVWDNAPYISSVLSNEVNNVESFYHLLFLFNYLRFLKHKNSV